MTATRHVIVLLVLATVAGAGCVTPSLPGDDPGAARVAPADWAALAVPFGEGHDHSDPAHHQGLSTGNFRVLGHDALVTEYHGATSGGYFCGDVAAEGERSLAFVHSFTTDVAFVVADVTDPAHPTMLGELVLPRTHVYDLAVTPDGASVLLATSPLDTGTDDGAPVRAATGATAPFFLDACTGEARPVGALTGLTAGPEGEAPFASGLVLVDTTDPANPVVADYRPQPVLGVHSVFATEIDGAKRVLASTTNLAHPASYFTFYSVTATPLGQTLTLDGAYRPVPQENEVAAMNGHTDGWIAKHPGTGATLAYLADWNGGLIVLDVTDPATPTEIGRWSNFDGDAPVGGYSPNSGSIHGTLPLPELRDGKHYTLVGQEILTRPRDSPTGLVVILDTTDPAAPAPVGAWTLPVDPEWTEDLLWSTHYFRVVGDTLFVSTYHAGVWAVDITDPARPRSAGVFVPDANATLADASKGGLDWTPLVMDVEPLPDGKLVVWDGATGVYVVEFDATRAAPAVEEWALDVTP